MTRLAFLYPGQGSQRVGMGAELEKSRPDLFERFLGEAEARSGLPLRSLCLEGTIEELTRTDVAQPAIFALSAALTQLALESGLEPSSVAGHSLGEYSAVVAAGALDFAAGLGLVCLRGRLMAQIQAERPGGMAAVSGLSASDVEGICRRAAAGATLVVANYNSDYQSVVSGESDAVDRVVALAQEAGAEQALRLNVGAAFHSPLMEPVQRRMAEAVEGVEWREPRCPVAVNVSGALVESSVDLKSALIAQVTSPVRWSACIRTLIGSGCDSFLELGPGRVLTGQARLIDHDLDAFAADGPKKLDNYLAAHPA